MGLNKMVGPRVRKKVGKSGSGGGNARITSMPNTTGLAIAEKVIRKGPGQNVWGRKPGTKGKSTTPAEHPLSPTRPPRA